MIEGYDSLSDRKVIARLHELGQAELAEVEGCEPTHRERAAVFAKLRYLPSAEPVAGYDNTAGLHRSAPRHNSRSVVGRKPTRRLIS